MKIFSVSIFTIVVLLIIGGCYSRVGESSYRAGYDFSKVDKIAIVAVEGAIKSEPVKNQIAEFFAMELLKKGYAPIGRAHVKTLLKESRNTSGLSEDLINTEGAAQMGQLLQVPAVLVVNIPYYGEEISMTAVMIDVEDGSFLWIGSDSGRTEGTISTFFRAGADTEAIAGEQNEQIFSGIIGGQLAITEQALTPGEAKRAQRLVQSVCRSLPPKAGQEKKGIYKRLF